MYGFTLARVPGEHQPQDEKPKAHRYGAHAVSGRAHSWARRSSTSWPCDFRRNDGCFRRHSGHILSGNLLGSRDLSPCPWLSPELLNGPRGSCWVLWGQLMARISTPYLPPHLSTSSWMNHRQQTLHGTNNKVVLLSSPKPASVELGFQLSTPNRSSRFFSVPPSPTSSFIWALNPVLSTSKMYPSSCPVLYSHCPLQSLHL